MKMAVYRWIESDSFPLDGIGVLRNKIKSPLPLSFPAKGKEWERCAAGRFHKSADATYVFKEGTQDTRIGHSYRRTRVSAVRTDERIIMANYETILIERRDNIATITFNRPHKRNAMNPKLHQEMVEILTQLRFDKDLRVLILTGAGESFSAGEDLKEFFYEQRDRMEFERLLDKALEWRVRILRAFPVPTIAAINGYCFGGAFSIVSGCDIAIAADEATFGLSEVNFGHFPGGPVSKQISQFMRVRDAIYYILTGDTFNGKRAAEIGFVTYSVPRASLMEEVNKLASKLAEKDALALRACKDAYRDSLLIPDFETALSYSSAKSDQLSFLQGGAWKDQGIKQFIEGQYRPGFGAFKKDK